MTDPTWISVAKAYIGTAEIPGPKSNPKILQWAKRVAARLGITYADDDPPWCGLFAATCVQSAGFDPPRVAIRAKSWAAFGEPLDHPVNGAVLVFQRQGGGHVGFYAGATDTAYRVLGGNQSNKVGYAWIAKDRCIAVRWPAGAPKGEAIRLTASGQLSTNEA
jgi:uncharacterized protein (TIGR02594 family)